LQNEFSLLLLLLLLLGELQGGPAKAHLHRPWLRHDDGNSGFDGQGVSDQ
jgi:hypothetical protein